MLCKAWETNLHTRRKKKTKNKVYRHVDPDYLWCSLFNVKVISMIRKPVPRRENTCSTEEEHLFHGTRTLVPQNRDVIKENQHTKIILLSNGVHVISLDNRSQIDPR